MGEESPNLDRENTDELDTNIDRETEGIKQAEKLGNTAYEIYAVEDIPEILNKKLQQEAEKLGIKPSYNLFYGAHPDSSNEVLPLLYEAQNNDPNLKTYLVSLTHGEKSNIYKGIMAAKCVFSGQFGKLKDLENLAVAPRRAKEFYKTARKMGFETILLNLPDQGLAERADEVKAIIKQTMEQFGPDNINTICTTDPGGTVELLATSEPHPDHQVVGAITTEVCDELQTDDRLFYCLFAPNKVPKEEQIEIKPRRESLKRVKEALRGRIDLIISARPAYKKTVGRLRSRALQKAIEEQGLKDQEKIKKLRKKMKGMWENDK